MLPRWRRSHGEDIQEPRDVSGVGLWVRHLFTDRLSDDRYLLHPWESLTVVRHYPVQAAPDRKPAPKEPFDDCGQGVAPSVVGIAQRLRCNDCRPPVRQSQGAKGDGPAHKPNASTAASRWASA